MRQRVLLQDRWKARKLRMVVDFLKRLKPSQDMTMQGKNNQTYFLRISVFLGLFFAQ
jgi:hypothetical protein